MNKKTTTHSARSRPERSCNARQRRLRQTPGFAGPGPEKGHWKLRCRRRSAAGLIPSGTLAFLLLIALAPSPARADEAVAGGGNAQLSLWALMQQGGWAMYPLGTCSLIMFFLIFYCTRETAKPRFVPAPAVPRLASLLESRDLEQAAEQLDATPSVLSRAMRTALLKARPDADDANKAPIESSLSESLEQEENGVGQWINYLNVVATVAPMIGLLGTVSGMIGAFQTISEGGMGRPEMLAGDIGQALVTTATGLMIGIPAMIAYFILRNRLNNQMLATARTATHLVDKLAGELPQEYEAYRETQNA